MHARTFTQRAGAFQRPDISPRTHGRIQTAVRAYASRPAPRLQRLHSSAARTHGAHARAPFAEAASADTLAEIPAPGSSTGVRCGRGRRG